MLSILAQSREPRAVQRHLPFCFEGIDTLTFTDPPSLLITHLNSAEGESVEFIAPISPLQSATLAPRGVEEWLKEIERSMRETLALKLSKTLEDLAHGTPRAQWLFRWPAQLIVAAEQTTWTSGVTEALETQQKSDPEALRKCHKYNE
jgi:dynein heavy chain